MGLCRCLGFSRFAQFFAVRTLCRTINTPNLAEQRDALRAFLSRENTLALATVNERGEASIAPLFYLVDQRLSLFWLSSPSSLHSQNLKREPRAAATVYRHTDKWKDVRGLQCGA